MATETVVL